MDSILPGTSIQNTYSPLIAGGKVGGNVGKGLAPAETSFGDAFANAVREVDELNAIKDQNSYNLAIGDVDNLAEIMTDAERAQTAFQLLVQMRNKVLDAYSEIMRMNI